MRSLLINHPFFRPEPSSGRADIYDDESRYLLHLEAAGFSHDEFNITATESTIHIRAEHTLSAPEGFEGKSENRTINRRFRFAKPVDSEAIEASVKNGMLTLALPKRAARQIEISVS